MYREKGRGIQEGERRDIMTLSKHVFFASLLWVMGVRPMNISGPKGRKESARSIELEGVLKGKGAKDEEGGKVRKLTTKGSECHTEGAARTDDDLVGQAPAFS